MFFSPLLLIFLLMTEPSPPFRELPEELEAPTISRESAPSLPLSRAPSVRSRSPPSDRNFPFLSHTPRYVNDDASPAFRSPPVSALVIWFPSLFGNSVVSPDLEPVSRPTYFPRPAILFPPPTSFWKDSYFLPPLSECTHVLSFSAPGPRPQRHTDYICVILGVLWIFSVPKTPLRLK